MIFSRILVAIGLLTLPLGLLMAVQGSFLYNLTSEASISSLVDDVIGEQFSRQSASFVSYCEKMNITCSSLEETVVAVCEKSHATRAEADSQALDSCNSYGLSCSTIEELRDEMCSVAGKDSQECAQLEMLVSSVTKSEQACSQMQDYGGQIDAQKDEIYASRAAGVSLKEINTSLEHSFMKGVVIFMLSVLLIYLGSRNAFTVSKSVFITFIYTGITLLVIWYFGSSFAVSAMPREITDNAHSVVDFIGKIFEFEYISGAYLILTGTVGIVLTYSAKMFFDRDKPRKNATQKTKPEKS